MARYVNILIIKIKSHSGKQPMINILDHNKVIIFGYPRCGTKLIAQMLTTHGYENLGEYFDTWTSKLVNNRPIRLSQHVQQHQHQQYIKSPDLENFSHTLELLNRTNTFDNPPIRTSVTLWYENIKIFPILSSIYQNHRWICAQRNNFDQLLSRIVVSINANPDGNYPSQRVDIKRSQFETQFWRLQEISLLQEHLVANQLAVKVQFEDVINGKFPDNLQTKVHTVDQHKDLYSYVNNINEVEGWYRELVDIKCSILTSKK
jgi:hypothetical protein